MSGDIIIQVIKIPFNPQWIPVKKEHIRLSVIIRLDTNDICGLPIAMKTFSFIEFKILRVCTIQAIWNISTTGHHFSAKISCIISFANIAAVMRIGNVKKDIYLRKRR